MAPCGRQTPSRERRKFVHRIVSMRSSSISLTLSHQRVVVTRRGRRGPSRPSAGGAGRAEGASLDRRRAGRQRLARPNGAATPNRAASLAHCADMLSAKENPNSCKVRPCQKSCDKSLHCHTIDRGAPWALYPAIKRSVVCASPVLRYPSPNCDRRKDKPTVPAVNSEQIRCGQCAGLYDRSRFARLPRLRLVVCGSNAGRRQGDRVSVGRGNVRSC
jgi:hypothetical protein